MANSMFDRLKPLPIPDIANLIVNVQSDKVPYSRLVKRGRAPYQMLQTWGMELYPDDGFEGTMDGADHAGQFGRFTRERAECYAMELRTLGVRVTQQAQLTRDAAVPERREFARQIMHDGKLWARKREAQLLSTMETRRESQSPDLPYRTRGAFPWLQSSAQAVLPVHADFRPPSEAFRTDPLDQLTEDAISEMLAAMSVQRGETVDLKCFCGLAFKRRMSLWGTRKELSLTDAIVTRFNQNAADKKLTQIIDRFEFDTGAFYAIPSFYLARDLTTGEPTEFTHRSALFMDTAMWELAELAPVEPFPLPDMGGGPRAFHRGTYIHKCLNPQGQGAWLTALDEASS